MNAVPHIEVRGLSMAYDKFVVQRDLNFTVNKADIFLIMGGNGWRRQQRHGSVLPVPK